MPDIDVDFCYRRRGEVIDYVNQKYGADHVAQIVTFGTMAAKGAIRDVGRALNVPYAEVDAIAKQVPNSLHMTLASALSLSKPLREMYESDPTVQKIIDTAKGLEACPATPPPTPPGWSSPATRWTPTFPWPKTTRPWLPSTP